MSAGFEPDRDQIHAFVIALFRHATPDSYVSLRSFDAVGSKARIRGVQLGGGFNAVIDAAVEVARSAALPTQPAVFCPPVATFNDPIRARGIDLVDGLVVTAELDVGNILAKRARLEATLGPPTVALISGGISTDPETGELHDKMHLHWRLAQPTSNEIEHENLRRARASVARLVGADPTAIPMVHPLRWPGSWNLKEPARPRMAMIVQITLSEVHLPNALGALLKALDEAGLAQKTRPAIGSDATHRQPSDRRLQGFIDHELRRVTAAQDGMKHFALRNAALSIGGIAEQAGLSNVQAIRLLLDALPSATVRDWQSAADTAAWGLKQGRARPIVLEDRELTGRPAKPRMRGWITARSVACARKSESSSFDTLSIEMIGCLVSAAAILGGSEVPMIRNTFTVFANGNNLGVGADQVRRTIQCALDANLEEPEHRRFASNPLAEILAQRGRYVADALIVARAYIIAGRPGRLPPMASYPGWSDLVRSSLVWLSRPDPVETTRTVAASDPKREARLAVFSAWAGDLQVNIGYQTPELIRAAEEYASTDRRKPDLFEALRSVATPRSGSLTIDPRQLGDWLRWNLGTVASGHKLEVDRSDAKRPRWRLTEAVGGDGGQPS